MVHGGREGAGEEAKEGETRVRIKSEYTEENTRARQARVVKGKRDGKGRIPRGGEPELSSQIIALARVQAPPQGVIRAGKEAVTALAVANSLSPSSHIRSAPAGGGQDPVTTSVKPSPPARDGLPPSCARRVPRVAP